ncbi:TolC family protein [Flammeovirga agarivorans]|uniref:TolC family protein n=1 Tax=Flammeovirga agarivorans TaxID=2726742 RepID=A0A7X8SKF1_9BACT|nr:TolC family protein [Flammeovirga agarivorans]NLR91871.1 TolC family protein [Flammeovirga agarivorans]
MKNYLLLIIGILMSSQIFAQSTLDSIPEEWSSPLDSIQTVEEITGWYKTFNDPILNELIQKTAENNLNVAQAVNRIEKGRIMHQQSQAGYFPSIGVDVSTTYSNNNRLDALTPDDVEDQGDWYYNAGVSMNWEIDVFGRIRKGAKAAKYSYEQAQEDKNAVMVSILSEVSTAYLNLRIYQNQIRVAEQNVFSQQRALDLARDQYQSGTKSKLAVLQSEGILFQTQSTIKTLEARVVSQINMIQVLMGDLPQGLKSALSQYAPLPDIPQELQTLLPAQVIRQRPDVRSAEKNMMKLSATVDMATAQQLPVIAIQGKVGFVSKEPDEWFTSESLSYFIGPKLTWNVFSGFYQKREKQISKIEWQNAQIKYQNTVLTAFKEVENSLMNIKQLKESANWMEQSVSATSEALDISLNQYQEGLIDYTPVLNSQQNLLMVQNQDVEIKGDLLIQIVKLYQSLGGNL